MKFSVLVTGVLALALPACATFDSVFGSRAADRYEAGLAAAQRGDFASAHRDLGWVIETHGSESIGQRALLTVAALEMDPRNPQRRLALGADLAGAYLSAQPENWSQPVAQTLYLIALELGATEERLAQVEADRRDAERRAESTTLPRLPAASATVPSRLKALSEERDKLANKVEQLEKQVAEKDKELDRIRKTLKR
jgi:hypothetical protein